MQIPLAKAALEKERTKLETRKAWDVKRVRPKAEVIAEELEKKRPVHFGSLMDLCHIKNSQLGKEFWTYNGRLFFAVFWCFLMVLWWCYGAFWWCSGGVLVRSGGVLVVFLW